MTENATPQPAVTEPKAGYKTSEFWVITVASLYTLAMASGLIPHEKELSDVIQAIAVLLAAWGYGAFRTALKASAVKKP